MATFSVIRIRFEKGGEVGPGFGPFEYVQMTYNELRIGPNGEPFAYLEGGEGGEWHIYPAHGDEGVGWSDVVVRGDYRG